MNAPTPHSSRRRKLALLFSALVLIVIAAVSLWPRQTDRSLPSTHIDAPTPPGPAPRTWLDASPDQGLALHLQDQGFALHDDTDSLLFELQTPEPIEWLSSHTPADDWNWHLAHIQSPDNTNLTLHLWHFPGLPVVLIDVEAELSPSALHEVLAIDLFSPSTGDAWLLDGALRTFEDSPSKLQNTPFQIGRFYPSHNSAPLQLTARNTSTLHLTDASTNDSIAISWTLFPDVAQFQECAQTDPDRTSLPLFSRLEVQFGEAPALLPDFPRDVESIATPVFVDPPYRSDNPWTDGRARTPDELASRFRALAMGHSNPDDPRYGNSGLLSANLGAVFALPRNAWDEPAIQDLRRSLKDTTIDVLPLHTFIPDTDEASSPLARPPFITNELSCQTLHALGINSPPILLREVDYERPSSAPLGLPLDPIIEFGQLPNNRAQILASLFRPNDELSLHRTGEHRLVAVPLIATRNPLVDSAQQELLSPDSGGHWTLHEDLTRELIAWEFSPASQQHHFLSLQQTVAPYATLTPFAYYRPDGTFPSAADLPERGVLQIDPANIITTTTPQSSTALTPLQIQVAR